jgi:3-deoxy-D-manno-octulosonic-acid transferase
MRLYRWGTRIYFWGLRFAALFNAKARAFVSGRKNWLAQLQAHFCAGGPTVWMHCASLGEFEQGRPVLEALRAADTKLKIVLTFFSPSGYQVCKNYAGADYVGYLPIDTDANAVRFLDAVRPSIVIFVKYDFWLGYLQEIKRRNIPALLISANIRPGMLRGFRRAFYLQALSCFSHIFTQHPLVPEMQRLLTSLPPVTVAGDTRADRVLAIAEQWQPLPAIEAFINGRKTIVAGSTWPADEKIIFSAFNQLNNNRLALIIAPHEVKDTHINALLKQGDGKAICFSQWQKLTPEVTKELKYQILIIDSIGILARLYKYADVVWIGGGFGAGIHNTLEAAVYGKVLAFGPRYHRFTEAIELIAIGTAQSIQTATALKNYLKLTLSDNQDYSTQAAAAALYVKKCAGATQVIVSYCRLLLQNVTNSSK